MIFSISFPEALHVFCLCPVPAGRRARSGRNLLLLPDPRVFGIARNYAEPGAATKDTPFYFMKDCYTVSPWPTANAPESRCQPQSQVLKHEIELVACLGKGGRNLTLEQAAEAVWGWCVGIDFTLGDQKLPSAPPTSRAPSPSSAPRP